VTRRIAVSVLLAVAVALAGAQRLTPEDRKNILGKITTVLAEKAYDPAGKLAKWPEVRDANAAGFAAAKTDEAFYDAVDNALRELGVSHLALLTPNVLSMVATRRTAGIGITGGMLGDEFVITRVFDGSPADDAGLCPGDTVTALDDTRPSWDSLFAEKEGGTVSVTYRTPQGDVHRRRIAKRKFSLSEADEFYPLTDRTAYIRIHSFMDGAYDAAGLQKAMRWAWRYKNIVLDLRENGGGTLTYAADLCCYLVGPERPLGYFINKAGVTKQAAMPYRGAARGLTALSDLGAIAKAGRLELLTPVPTSGPFKGRLVLLIDGSSASASEVVAASLVELGCCTAVIGEASAGALLASQSELLPKGGALQYPECDYVTHGGIRIEGNSVQPTIHVSTTDVLLALQRDEVDPAIAKALEVLGDE
jgi:carboxyl-terminal processing protease